MTSRPLWLRYVTGTLHVVLSFALMLPLAIAFFPYALVTRTGAFAACKTWCRATLWLARVLCGLRTEVRGAPPEGEVLIAAKHQSFLDIILIFSQVPRGRFIMKRELMWAPILGQYALWIGCVPVARGKRAEAIRKMVEGVKRGRIDPGQLIIYPQGTRIPPGVKAPYKVGAAVLYEELKQPCVPVACNVGLFWPKRGVLRHPGLAVVEFLDPIPAGLPQDAFRARLEEVVETRSNALMREAGFDPEPPT